MVDSEYKDFTLLYIIKTCTKSLKRSFFLNPDNLSNRSEEESQISCHLLGCVQCPATYFTRVPVAELENAKVISI